MDQLVDCLSCDKEMRAPSGTAGKRIQCGDCDAIHRIHEDDDGDYYLELLDVPAAAGEAPGAQSADDGLCPSCGVPVQSEEAFCTGCGANLEDARRQAAARAAGARRDAALSARRRRKTTHAAVWIMVLAGLFLVVGTIQGLAASTQAQEAYRNLDRYEDEEMLTFEGEQLTAAEWRAAVRSEVVLTFAINYLVAAIMIGLFFWARRSPFPAILTALCVYLVLIVLNAIVEPKTLVQGVLWKVLILSALIGGLKAALAERVAGARSQPAAATP